MTIQTVSYLYEPTPNDIANFEAIWLELWHPQCKFLNNTQYNFFRSFAFDNFLLGINQHKLEIKISLERSLHNDN